MFLQDLELLVKLLGSNEFTMSSSVNVEFTLSRCCRPGHRASLFFLFLFLFFFQQAFHKAGRHGGWDDRLIVSKEAFNWFHLQIKHTASYPLFALTRSVNCFYFLKSRFSEFPQLALMQEVTLLRGNKNSPWSLAYDCNFEAYVSARSTTSEQFCYNLSNNLTQTHFQSTSRQNLLGKAFFCLPVPSPPPS